MPNLPDTAVLIATAPERANSVFGERHPAPMLPLVDRPFLQHVVEYLIDLGVRNFHFILSTHPEAIECHFGDGRRWGCQFTYHLAQDPERPFRALALARLWKPAASFVLAYGEVLPFGVGGAVSAEGPSVIWSGGRWTGWAVLGPGDVERLRLDGTALETGGQLRRLVMQKGRLVEAEKVLSVETAEELLRSQRAVLEGEFPQITLYGREVRPGLRVCRNAHLDHTAQVAPPVFLHSDCRIGAGCTLGPNVAVGRECVLAENTTVSEAAIFDHSYAGEALTIKQALVDGPRLHHVRLGTEVVIADDLILDNLDRRPLAEFLKGELSRVCGLALLLILLPVMLLVFLVLWVKGRRPVVYRTQVVQLPTSERSLHWQSMSLASFCAGTPQDCNSLPHHFLFHFLPGLPHVARRQLHLVGVPLRTVQQMATMDSGWRKVYSKSKPGLVTEALVNLRGQVEPGDLEAAESYYASRVGIRRDAKLLVRYFAGVAREAVRKLAPHSASRTRAARLS